MNIRTLVSRVTRYKHGLSGLRDFRKIMAEFRGQEAAENVIETPPRWSWPARFLGELNLEERKQAWASGKDRRALDRVSNWMDLKRAKAAGLVAPPEVEA